MSEDRFDPQQWHREQAVRLFNATWELIEQPARTAEDTLRMIHMAHASRYHWGEVGTHLEFARGEWQVSRVYALAGMAESALYHAQASLAYCQTANIADFDLAFAYEALARAYSLIPDEARKQHYLALGREAAQAVQEEDDRKYVLGEIDSIR